MVITPLRAVQKRGLKSYLVLADYIIFKYYMAKVKIRWASPILEGPITCLNFFSLNPRRNEWLRNYGQVVLT